MWTSGSDGTHHFPGRAIEHGCSSDPDETLGVVGILLVDRVVPFDRYAPCIRWRSGLLWAAEANHQTHSPLSGTIGQGLYVAFHIDLSRTVVFPFGGDNLHLAKYLRENLER